MISKTLANDIAGEVLVRQFDKDILRKNIERLYMDRSVEKGNIIFSFGIFNEAERANRTNRTGIWFDETVFPEIFLRVNVNLLNGTASVLEKDNDVIK